MRRPLVHGRLFGRPAFRFLEPTGERTAQRVQFIELFLLTEYGTVQVIDQIFHGDQPYLQIGNRFVILLGHTVFSSVR